jgi:hypothetical protein
MNCTHCGANLYEEMGVKELCYVLTSQYLSFGPDPIDQGFHYHDMDVLYEDTKECTLHCGECGEDVTPEQADTLRCVMGY